MYSSPLLSHHIPLSPKYRSQRPILEHPQPMSLPQSERPRFTPIQNNRENYTSVYLNLHTLYSELIPILILSSHLRLGLPSGLFPAGFPTKTLYVHRLCPIRATCPAYLIRINLITRIIFSEEYRLSSSSLCILLHSPVTSSL